MIVFIISTISIEELRLIPSNKYKWVVAPDNNEQPPLLYMHSTS